MEALLTVRQTMVKESLRAGVRPAASVYVEGALEAGVCGGGSDVDRHLGPVSKPSQWDVDGRGK